MSRLTSPSCNDDQSADSFGPNRAHRCRLSLHRDRQRLFVEEFRKLTQYLLSDASRPKTITAPEQYAELYDVKFGDPEKYTMVSQCNIGGLSILLRARLMSSNERDLYARTLSLVALRAEFRTLLIEQSLRIIRYFAANRSSIISSNTGGAIRKNSFFLRIVDVFLEPDQRAIVLHESFNHDCSLQHRIWNGAWSGSYQMSHIKRWTMQLADAIEVLNQCGVAHRFVRPENALLSGDDRSQIKLAAFDFACIYWDGESSRSVPISPRLLPFDFESRMIDHLPPECFADGYDASMLDVWSIGTIVCKLLTGYNPFGPLIENALESGAAVPNSGFDGNPAGSVLSGNTICEATAPILSTIDFVRHWKCYDGRRSISEEMRSLLDDVFRDADSRITAWELATDKRLTCRDAKEFIRTKPPAYYRIDLKKNININGPPSPFASSGMMTASAIQRQQQQPALVIIPQSTFSSNSKDIFLTSGYEQVDGGTDESAITKYTILRDQSFVTTDRINTDRIGCGEMDCIISDGYLKAMITSAAAAAAGTESTKIKTPPVSISTTTLTSEQQQQSSQSSSQNCLAKIYQLKMIPVRHRNMLLNESGKIMRYISNDRTLSRHTHRILDIYLVGHCVYLFAESLQHYHTLFRIVQSAFASAAAGTRSINQDQEMQIIGSEAVMQISASAITCAQQLLTLANVQAWMIAVTEVIQSIGEHGLAHRYVRPEYVYVHESNPQMIKLGHFDMSCFVWNPEKSVLVKRSRGIQDELEHRWNHLPPECYDTLYDCRSVDVWSIGTLLGYCVTGKPVFNLAINDFIPLSFASAAEQWIAFKHANKQSAMFTAVLDTLEAIFAGLGSGSSGTSSVASSSASSINTHKIERISPGKLIEKLRQINLSSQSISNRTTGHHQQQQRRKSSLADSNGSQSNRREKSADFRQINNHRNNNHRTTTTTTATTTTTSTTNSNPNNNNNNLMKKRSSTSTDRRHNNNNNNNSANNNNLKNMMKSSSSSSSSSSSTGGGAGGRSSTHKTQRR